VHYHCHQSSNHRRINALGPCRLGLRRRLNFMNLRPAQTDYHGWLHAPDLGSGPGAGLSCGESLATSAAEKHHYPKGRNIVGLWEAARMYDSLQERAHHAASRHFFQGPPNNLVFENVGVCASKRGDPPTLSSSSEKRRKAFSVCLNAFS
jgi:hypothetical protein